MPKHPHHIHANPPPGAPHGPLARFLEHPHAPSPSGLFHALLGVAEPLLIALAGLAVLALIARIALRGAERRAAAEGTRFALALPEALDRDALAALFQSLTVLLRRRLFGPRPWIGFSLVACDNQVRVEAFCSGGAPAQQVLAALEHALPGTSIERCSSTRLSAPPGSASAGTLVPAQSPYLPFKPLVPDDPVRLVLAALVAGAPGEGSVVQLLLRPAPGGAHRRARQQADRLRTGKGLSRLSGAGVLLGATLAFLGFVLEVVVHFWDLFAPRAMEIGPAPAGAGQSSPKPQHHPLALEQARMIDEKACSPLLSASLRLAAFAPTRRTARERVHGLAAGFGPLEIGSQLRRAREPHLWERLHTWLLPPSPRLLLTPTEAAAFLPLPESRSAHTLTLSEAPARRLAPAAEAARSGLVIGRSDRDGFSDELRISVEALPQHVHVLGPIGSGKSTLLLNMALEAIGEGLGLLMAEPKGDLIQWLLERIPAERMSDVELIDLADEEHPPAFNLLACAPEDADLHAEALTAIFRRAFTRFWGPRSDDILRAALGTLLTTRSADGLDPTLADVLDLLTRPGARSKQVSDPVALERFWRQWDSLSTAQREQALAPLSNKLRSFLYRTQLRRVLCQPGAPSFERMIEERKIVLFPLQVGRLGRDAASLIGSVITYRLWQAAQRLGPSVERRPYLCMLDEFHNFCHLPQGLAEALAEARGYRLGFVLAHQYLGQLREREIAQAIDSSCLTKICFSLAPEDAHRMAPHFEPRLSEQDLMRLGAHRIAARVCHQGRTLPAATAATAPAPPCSTEFPERWIRRRARARAPYSGEMVDTLIEQRYRHEEQPARGSATADETLPPGLPPDLPPDGRGLGGESLDEHDDLGDGADPDNDAA
jgi:hypothetical protein